MTTETVLADVAAERERQIAKWGGAANDDQWNCIDWHEMIADYNAWARRIRRNPRPKGRPMTKHTILALMLAGCAPMSTLPEYPALPASITRIPDNQVYAKCARAWPLWQHLVMFPILPMGCAERFPQHNVCIIWVGETSANWVVEHEKKHCLGHVH